MKALIQLILSFFNKEKRVDKRHVEKYVEENQMSAEEKSKATTPVKPVEFKTESKVRLSKEWPQLKKENQELYDLIEEANEYTNKEFKKNLIITMIYRTDAEQDYLYRDSEKYAKKKFKSPHQFWHAVDLRSRTFTESEIKKLVAWFNKKANKNNYYRWTAKCHTVGKNGRHFHAQFVKK